MPILRFCTILFLVNSLTLCYADDYRQLIPVTINYTVIDAPDAITDSQQAEAIARTREVFLKELRIKVKPQVDRVPEFSPMTAQSWQLESERLRQYKYAITYLDLDHARYNLLADRPLLIDGFQYFGGLAAGICVKPGAGAVALAHARDYSSINFNHLKYRFSLAQMHEIGHLLGAAHTEALDYDMMNTNILQLAKTKTRATVNFAARSIAAIRLCVADKLATLIYPATRCEKKLTRTNKVRCYIRRASRPI